LVPGLYDAATSFPSQVANEPSLSVSGESRACGKLMGEFEVLEISHGPDGEVLGFPATFEQHCQGGDPALFGAVRFRSPASVTVKNSEPPLPTSSDGSSGPGGMAANQPSATTAPEAQSDLVLPVATAAPMATLVPVVTVAPVVIAPPAATPTPTPRPQNILFLDSEPGDYIFLGNTRWI